MNENINITRHGLFSQPRKVIPSPRHDFMLVMGDHAIYSYSDEDGRINPIQGSTSHTFTDMAVSKRGELLLLMKDVDGDEHILKILDVDFFKVLAKFLTEGLIPAYGTFSADGNVVAVSDNRDVSDEDVLTSLFHRVNFDLGVMTTESRQTLGYVVGSHYDEGSNRVFSITSGGEVWVTSGSLSSGESVMGDVNLSSSSSQSDTSTGESSNSSAESESELEFVTYKVAELGFNITASAGILKTATEGASPQEKVRIFVGSQPWLNDRWDSGEVSTSVSEMQYGGGDNLEKGQKYWVHIMTCHSDSGWSRPQIREFVVPR